MQATTTHSFWQNNTILLGYKTLFYRLLAFHSNIHGYCLYQSMVMKKPNRDANIRKKSENNKLLACDCTGQPLTTNTVHMFTNI